MNDGARLSQSGLYGMLAGILWILNSFLFLLPAEVQGIASPSSNSWPSCSCTSPFPGSGMRSARRKFLPAGERP